MRLLPFVVSCRSGKRGAQAAPRFPVQQNMERDTDLYMKERNAHANAGGR